MSWRFAIFCLILSSSFAALISAETLAQEGTKTRRNLAAGVLTVIPHQAEEAETFHGPMPLAEVVRHLKKKGGFDWDPNYTAKSETLLEKTRNVTLRHEAWSLEFAFKPLRMMYIDVPQPTGKMQRKLIWYMVYRVKNTGAHLAPATEQDDHGNPVHKTVASKPGTIRFFPHFVLEGTYRDEKAGKYQRKTYLDRYLPITVKTIDLREKPPGKLHDSVSISSTSIPLSDKNNDRSVWGVVTWEDVDPRVDYFSIYIQGLSNAFHFQDLPDGKREYQHKTLQLNFWRPGDTRAENEGEVRYGVRLVADPVEQERIYRFYNLKDRLDHLWIYR